MARKKKSSVVHKNQKSLNEFYTDNQRREEQREKYRKEHELLEAEIFEHLKEHTKKVLRQKNIR